MSAAGLQDKRFLGADVIEIRLADVFIILHPPSGQVELALGVVCDKLLDDFPIFVIVGQPHLREVGLSDGTVAGEKAVAVRLEKTGIDEVAAVVGHLRIRTRERSRFLLTADVGKHAVFDHCRLGKGLFLIHGDDVAENNRLLHDINIFKVVLLCRFSSLVLVKIIIFRRFCNLWPEKGFPSSVG